VTAFLLYLTIFAEPGQKPWMSMREVREDRHGKVKVSLKFLMKRCYFFNEKKWNKLFFKWGWDKQE
jgi:hypothetical protein